MLRGGGCEDPDSDIRTTYYRGDVMKGSKFSHIRTIRLRVLALARPRRPRRSEITKAPASRSPVVPRKDEPRDLPRTLLSRAPRNRRLRLLRAVDPLRRKTSGSARKTRSRNSPPPPKRLRKRRNVSFLMRTRTTRRWIRRALVLV